MGNAAPQGLDCELEIQGVPGLQYDHQIFSLAVPILSDKFVAADDGAKSDSVLHWSTAPVTSHAARVDFVLSGAAGTNWAMVQNSKPTCLNRSEKLNDKT
jgi:hypothetical protein